MMYFRILKSYYEPKNFARFISVALKASLYPTKWIAKLIDREARILDVGCGEGILSNYLACMTNRTVVGVDLDEKKIREARASQVMPNISFNVDDFLQLSRDEKYDLVVVNDVLHHIKSHELGDFVRKLEAVLNPNGKVLVKDVTELSSLDAKLTTAIDRKLYKVEIELRTQTELENTFLEVGLQLRSKKKSLHPWPACKNLIVFGRVR